MSSRECCPQHQAWISRCPDSLKWPHWTPGVPPKWTTPSLPCHSWLTILPIAQARNLEIIIECPLSLTPQIQSETPLTGSLKTQPVSCSSLFLSAVPEMHATKVFGLEFPPEQFLLTDIFGLPVVPILLLEKSRSCSGPQTMYNMGLAPLTLSPKPWLLPNCFTAYPAFLDPAWGTPVSPSSLSAGHLHLCAAQGLVQVFLKGEQQFPSLNATLGTLFKISAPPISCFVFFVFNPTIL